MSKGISWRGAQSDSLNPSGINFPAAESGSLCVCVCVCLTQRERQLDVRA